MNFWFTTNDGTMAIDNENLKVDLSGVPSDVRLVIWDGNGHIGEVEKKGQMALRTRFADSSTYQPQINRWILAAQTPPSYGEAPPSPPITLAQAKRIKCDMVDDLFLVKVAATTGAGPADITNAAVAALRASVNAMVDSFNAQIATFNAGMSSRAAALDSSLYGMNAAVESAHSSLVSADGALAAVANNNAAISNAAIGNADSNTTHLNVNYVDSINAAIGSGSVGPDGGSVSFTAMPHQVMPSTLAALSAVPTLTPPAAMPAAPALSPLPPLGTMNHVASDPATDPTAALEVVRQQKNNAVNALTTVPAVAAYDVKAGW